MSPRARTAALALAALAAALAALAHPAVRGEAAAAVTALSEAEPERAVAAVRDWLLGFGAWAPAASAALMILQAVVAPLPAFVITFANGLLFGWAWGAALSWTSAMAGAAVCFGLARALGRPAVERLAGRAALAAADGFFARRGGAAVLVARLLPFVPFDPVSYAAGLTSMRLWPFLAATGLGQLPATLLYSWLGARATGSARALFWILSSAAALAVVAWVWRRRAWGGAAAGGEGA